MMKMGKWDPLMQAASLDWACMKVTLPCGIGPVNMWHSRPIYRIRSTLEHFQVFQVMHLLCVSTWGIMPNSGLPLRNIICTLYRHELVCRLNTTGRDGSVLKSCSRCVCVYSYLMSRIYMPGQYINVICFSFQLTIIHSHIFLIIQSERCHEAFVANLT